MDVKEETQELLACRICLATDTELYNIQNTKLQATFVALMGSEVRWRGLGCFCGVCRAQLSRAAALRMRCRRAQTLLTTYSHRITIDYIRTIDRVAEKLCLNLKTDCVYSSDSTLTDVKQEIKEEVYDFTENIFISEPDLDDDSFIHTEIENKVEETNQKSNKNVKHPKIEIKNKRKTVKNLPKPTKATKKLPAPTKKLPETKRVIKRRVADNGFLPDFNFEEFESKYNVKIDILSKEEQLREIEARKMELSYTMAAFGCETCGKAFATKPVYEAHTMKHDPTAGAHSCGVCGVRFRTRSRALVHADAHRLRFTCAACGFVTRTRFIAKNHFLSHSGATHRCPHCEAEFTKYTSYLTHVRRRHPAMNVACDECGETFVGQNGLRHHKTRVHRNGALVKPARYSCSVCRAPFVSESALNSHAKEAVDGCDDHMNPCAQCGASQRDAALAHAERCPATRERLCQECDKTFVDGASFDTHWRRVHLRQRAREPPRPRPRARAALVCELCGAECSSVSSLAGHQRRHSGARPHACPAPACPLSFATRHNMRRHHAVIHLGQRPLVSCGVCGKQLAHAASLKLHVNTVHLKLPPRTRKTC